MYRPCTTQKSGYISPRSPQNNHDSHVTQNVVWNVWRLFEVSDVEYYIEG